EFPSAPARRSDLRLCPGGRVRVRSRRGAPEDLKAGETYYEQSGVVHSRGRNPSTKTKTRVLAVILHPRDAKEVTTPAGDECTMRVFGAGASGAIGRPLIAELVRRGHEVTGMTHSESGARDLAALGAAVARVSAFDAAAVEDALRDARAEAVIDELTSLPKDPSRMAETDAENHKLRLEGGGNLHRAARACGARRYIQQTSGFFLEAGD